MVTSTLPGQVLLGVYLGIITGIVPALVAWTLGFLFKYLTGVTIPGFGVVVLGLAVAGINGGLLALNDRTVRQSENATALIVAIVVVLMLTFYAHAKGDQMGAELPKRLTLKGIRKRSLSADVIELAGSRGQVNVTVSGDVADMEGYPPLPAQLRAELRAVELSFPADLPLDALETRVEERLRSDFDLADVAVRLDERARATVAAAPPTSGLSKRVPTGKRAVSVSALVPTGMARGDEVRLTDDGTDFVGSVVSARSGGPVEKPAAASPSQTGTGGGDDEETEPTPAPSPLAPTTTGGEGRVTVAVDRSVAPKLLAREVSRLVVRSRGVRREFELTALLRRAGKRFRKLTVREGGALDGNSIGEVAVRDTYDVVVLAVRAEGRWRLAPGGGLRPTAGSELFAVGTHENLDKFAAEVA